MEEKEIKKPEEQPEYERTPTLIEDAHNAADRLEDANARMEELIKRQEFLATEEALGGKSEGGISEEKPKEETPEEYAKRIMRGEVNETGQT